ncbi:MAG TPA: glycosyltransferase [Blastocatellia bacterium]|nr:glycosyltransferase [Blastocatellia bacterium]
MKSACLAVLNYDGLSHLKELLPTLRAACLNSPVPCSVVVLDNRSTENDVEWVREGFPEMRCVVSPANDFLFSYNWLLQQLTEDVVVLLNNDLRVSPDFLTPLLRHLENEDVFAASACSFDWEGTHVTSGPARLEFNHGFYGWPFDLNRQETCHTLFCSGGFMAVDRRKFLSLGGFNRLFHPAYCEDLDLCFRAWRQGWRCIYEPASVVWHREQASWSKSDAGRPNLLHLQNSLLFQWAALPMESDKAARILSTGKILLGTLAKGNFFWLRTYLRASSAWLRLQRQYASMKVARPQLETILERINQAC